MEVRTDGSPTKERGWFTPKHGGGRLRTPCTKENYPDFSFAQAKAAVKRRIPPELGRRKTWRQLETFLGVEQAFIFALPRLVEDRPVQPEGCCQLCARPLASDRIPIGHRLFDPACAVYVMRQLRKRFAEVIAPDPATSVQHEK